MPQVMIYLDRDTAHQMRVAAERAGLPYSRWVAGLIRAAARSTWPVEFLQLGGSVPDAPLAAEIRATDAKELPREPW
jgi:hypothetical protein